MSEHFSFVSVVAGITNLQRGSVCTTPSAKRLNFAEPRVEDHKPNSVLCTEPHRGILLPLVWVHKCMS